MNPKLRKNLGRRPAAAPGDAEAKAQQRRIERALQRLEADIQRLRIDSQRFLAGDLPTPPEELRESIQERLRRLRGSNLKAAAESFRLNALEARFNSYSELYARRQRQLEEGQGRRHPVAAEPAPNAEEGVVIGQRLDDRGVAALYEGLYLRDGERNPKTDLGRFRSYLDRQAQMIRQKTGCSEIVFRVAKEEGKMKLKAKPLPPS